jgi:hypothetical protein
MPNKLTRLRHHHHPVKDDLADGHSDSLGKPKFVELGDDWQ